MRHDLFLAQPFHRFQSNLHPFKPNPRIEEAGVGRKIFTTGQVTTLTHEKRFQRRQIKGEPAIDYMIGSAHQWNDAKQLTGADIMPMQNRGDGTVIAMPQSRNMRRTIRTSVNLVRRFVAPSPSYIIFIASI